MDKHKDMVIAINKAFNEDFNADYIQLVGIDTVVDKKTAIPVYHPITKEWKYHSRWELTGLLRVDLFAPTPTNIFEMGDEIVDFFNKKTIRDVYYEFHGYGMECKKVDNASIYTSIIDFEVCSHG